MPLTKLKLLGIGILRSIVSSLDVPASLPFLTLIIILFSQLFVNCFSQIFLDLSFRFGSACPAVLCATLSALCFLFEPQIEQKGILKLLCFSYSFADPNDPSSTCYRRVIRFCMLGPAVIVSLRGEIEKREKQGVYEPSGWRKLLIAPRRVGGLSMLLARLTLLCR